MPHGDPYEHCASGTFPTLESLNYCIQAAQDGLSNALNQHQASNVLRDWQRQLDNLLREKESFTSTNISDNMVTQKLDYFSIEGNRVIGQITFTSTENFNPYYYGKNIVSILQLKDRNNVTLTIKQNNLRFFVNARDQIIKFNESAHGKNYLMGQSFVSVSYTHLTLPTKRIV